MLRIGIVFPITAYPCLARFDHQDSTSRLQPQSGYRIKTILIVAYSGKRPQMAVQYSVSKLLIDSFRDDTRPVKVFTAVFCEQIPIQKLSNCFSSLSLRLRYHYSHVLLCVFLNRLISLNRLCRDPGRFRQASESNEKPRCNQIPR